MNLIRPFFTILGLLIPFLIQAQSNLSKSDSLENSTSFLKENIVPITLIGTGTLVNYLDHGELKVRIQQELLGDNPMHQTYLDDYIQYIPTGELYLFHLLGVESENNLFVKTKYLIFAQVGSSLVTHGLKRLTQETRPNGSKYSFPSGHTSQAFAGASVLWHEYKSHDKFIAWSGYGFATFTGILRVVNNEHWVSDVIVGAGIPILITNIVYQIEPLKKWDGIRFSKKMNILPSINIQEGVSIQLNLVAIQ